MRYSKEHKAQTRDRVLKEAAAVLRANGPDRLAVAEVMNRAGLTHGGFYSHFANRDELLSEAVGYMFRDRYDHFFSDSDMAEPRVALQRFVDSYLSVRHCKARDTGCPIPILAGELHRLPAKAQGRFDQAVTRLTQGVAVLLERMGVEPAQSRATSAVAEMVGAVAIARTLASSTAVAELLHTAKASVEEKLALS